MPSGQPRCRRRHWEPLTGSTRLPRASLPSSCRCCSASLRRSSLPALSQTA